MVNEIRIEPGGGKETIVGRARALTRFLPKDDWIVVGWTFGIKIVLFVFGVKAYRVLENKYLTSVYSWFELWNRWDALHYQRIAQFGYSATDTVKSWFYPLFPWTTRIVAFVTHDYLIAGFVVSGIALIFAAILLRRLVALDFPAPIALRSVFFFLIFPGAYFLHIGYTESLFLAFAFGSLFAARKNRWPLAGALGALAWMTRANGIIIGPTLAVEALHQLWKTRKWDWRWLWIGLVPAGFGVYLLVNWHVTGDPFWFLAARRRLFYLWPVWPWQAIREVVGNIHRGPTDGEMVGTQEFVFAMLALVGVVFSWIKTRPSYALWMTAHWLLFCSINMMGSMPRYSLAMFPIFVFFALAARNRVWFAMITLWSILFLALFSALFVRGWWAF